MPTNATRPQILLTLLQRGSLALGILIGLHTSVLANPAYKMTDFESWPVGLTGDSSIPEVLINTSNDHQLFFKAYSDYSDVDKDGTPDTTYKNSIDYYGYFDSNKCYDYDTTNKRFVPKATTASKYCTAADGNDAYWSGNFLNWASMTRIDAIRKILFGGMRKTDTSTDTVLERAYIPPDIHAFAKYYNGADINDLVPFTVTNITPPTTTNSANYTNGATTVTATAVTNIKVGDYISIANPAKTVYTRGWVTKIAGNVVTLTVKVTVGSGTITAGTGVITNYTRTGITLCNVSYDATGAEKTAKTMSDKSTAPPLIRVAEGNYSFWSAGEVHQCLWEDEDASATYGTGNGANYNEPELSSIYAAQDNPLLAVKMGLGDYVARVQVCVDADKDGKLDFEPYNENCGQYPYGNFKPRGLLQSQGEPGKLKFGMIAGTFSKPRTGGDIIQLIANTDGINGMCREINLGQDCNGDGKVDSTGDINQLTKFDDFVQSAASLGGERNIGDGTFKRVYNSVGGTISTANKGKAEGLINTWSLYRIVGYQIGVWNYNDTSKGDNCSLSINFFGDASDSQCRNWGNPFGEIYLSSLRYFGGSNSPTAYQASDSTVIDGLNYNTGLWQDPLTADNYCAQLNVVNFNSSTPSEDTAFSGEKKPPADELDTSSYGVVKDFGSADNTRQLTDKIGQVEGIYATGKKWFVGETNPAGSSYTTLPADARICTPKTISSLGDTRGLCPEGPGLRGGFRTAGLAWYAHTHDLRASGTTALKGTQKVDTFAVRLASGNPVIQIPVPGSTTGQKVTLLPACIDNNKANNACTLVDFKIVEPYTESGGTGHGKFLAIWEDSIQGNDYDLDAGGIIDYTITSTQITIKTAITLQNLGYKIGHGYVLGGTTKDGMHIHSGTNGFTYTDPLGTLDCKSGCSMGTTTSQAYAIGKTDVGLLEDPLWYAAKWGGFKDANSNNLPDLDYEWDEKDNATGNKCTTDQFPADPNKYCDGIPDNYYFATNPYELEDSLQKVLNAILERTSSGTAAAVVSSNVRGEGALYQAYYEPMRKDQNEKEAHWLGTVQALWLDKAGLSRQDCSPPRGYDSVNDKCIPPVGPCIPNGQLDNYCVDQVVETFYDSLEERTRTRVYDSNDPNKFEPYAMQGVVSTFSSGNAILVPNSMEGLVTYTSGSNEMALKPYSVHATVTAYDPDTGAATVDIGAGDWTGPAGATFNQWRVTNPVGAGFSHDPIALAAATGLALTIDPVGDWITVGDTLTLATQNLVGKQGETFNDWYVTCIDGGGADGEVTNMPITLTNWEGATFIVTPTTNDFTACNRARIETYNMKGVAGTSYSSWTVQNLDTAGKGTSSSALALANHGSLSLFVDPTSNWLAPGDRVILSNYQFSDMELYDTSYIWNARESLYLSGITDANLGTNRAYSTPASAGRYIMTWIDKDLDNVVDAGEFIPFEKTMFPAVNPGFFDAKTQAAAEETVDYVRGIEVPGTRNRTIQYAFMDGKENVMRLGDIVNSTPTVVASPQEAFNILYGDASYTAFRQQYQNRRIVVYAGGNDGLLHAFNSGFYNQTTVDDQQVVQYVTSIKDADGNPLAAHPLGTELWAYAPKNLLSHLQWLKDPLYNASHVYYMDAKPRVFDANIFSPDKDHPNGWGTLLVAGMNIGGGRMDIDTQGNDGSGTVSDNIYSSSAYVIFDITNPEAEPRLLGELQIPDASFTTVFPAVTAARDVDPAKKNCDSGLNNCNQWYLLFGTGPDNLVNVTSAQTAKVYLFNLAQLTVAKGTPKPAAATTVPLNCGVKPLYNGSVSTPLLTTTNMNIITCDTLAPNTFVGTPVVVDWNKDFFADTAYLGLVGDQTGTVGQLMRFDFNNMADPVKWDPMHTLFQTDQPVSIAPVPGVDKKNNKWIFFGTGRFHGMTDRSSTATQSIYGIKDDSSGTTVGKGELLNVTSTEVYNDRSLTGGPPPLAGGTPIANFDSLVKEIDDHATGWYLDLPPILGVAGTAPATRSVTNMALVGGILFAAVYQPSDDPCAGEGRSRLYGLYYKTGTAYPGPTVFGTAIEDVGGKVAYRALRYLDLGLGTATSPAIHSGLSSGDNSVSAFTQLSTGEIVRTEAETVIPVRTGKLNWREQEQ